MPQILTKNEDWLEEYEGQLAIDVYETSTDLIVKAPIAGITRDDLEISITDDVINIKGERHRHETSEQKNYWQEECYWGAFSRSFSLPVPVEADKADAKLINGILTITIPKIYKAKTQKIEIK